MNNDNVHVQERLCGTQIVFFRFVVNGDEVKITKYSNSDLIFKMTMPRAEARIMWKRNVQDGFKTV